MQRVMVEAPFRILRRTLPHMYAGAWGRVVNISSVHGLRASAYKSAYVTAKHALEGLIEPAEVAEAALWLCTGRSGCLTGSSIPLDGGWTARWRPSTTLRPSPVQAIDPPGPWKTGFRGYPQPGPGRGTSRVPLR